MHGCWRDGSAQLKISVKEANGDDDRPLSVDEEWRRSCARDVLRGAPARVRVHGVVARWACSMDLLGVAVAMRWKRRVSAGCEGEEEREDNVGI